MECLTLAKAQRTFSCQNQHQKQSAEKPATKHPMVALQQSIGNRAVQRLINSPYIQTKLQVGAANDPYEQEADQVAARVMRMPDSHTSSGITVSNRTHTSQVNRKCAECEEEMQRQPMEEEEKEETIQPKLQSPIIQRVCSQCAEDKVQRQPLEKEEKPLEKEAGEEERLQGKFEGAGSEVSSGLETQIASLRGGGQSLPESARAFFEPRFGQDFSSVRVHTGAQAAHVARSVNARAFTLGRDIAFGAAQYSPETSSGRKLLAHELTHVVQQTGGTPVTNQGASAPFGPKEPGSQNHERGV